MGFTITPDHSEAENLRGFYMQFSNLQRVHHPQLSEEDADCLYISGCFPSLPFSPVLTLCLQIYRTGFSASSSNHRRL